MAEHDCMRLVIVGSGGVGKSALTVMYVKNYFVPDYDPTIEDIYRKQVNVDGRIVLLDILDTAGQEEYTALTDQWYREGNGFIIVYSITSRQSVEEAIRIREKILRCQDKDNVPIMLVGNKCDLEKERQVSTHEGKQLAVSMQCGFMEASALANINTNEIWHELVRRVREARLAQPKARNDRRRKFCTLM